MYLLAQSSPGMPTWAQLVPIVAIIMILYFVLIRPQRRKDKQRKAMLGAHVAEHGWVCPGFERQPHPVAPGKLTARPQRFLARHRFPGTVHPVNPRRETVLGLPAHASIS